MSTPRPPLRQALAEYLSLRRALGYRLDNAERLLGQFLDYLDQRDSNTITIEDVLAWAVLPARASRHWWAIRVSVVRGFATYLHGTDPRVQVPPAGLIRCGPCRATPYLYSDAEIRALMRAAAELRPQLRAATYQTLIALLAVSGLRIGEVIAADEQDLDLGDGVLLVRHAKFDKQRLVPLHPSTVRALDGYLRLRHHLHPRAGSPALFISTAGTRLLHSNIGLTFAQLTSQAGLTRRSATCRPRIHDVRHSFAVNVMLDWYATGADVPAMMPQLSTYLGHTDPKHTYWYLSAAPELMGLAGQRLDTYLGGGRS
jgi:integrase/recombinase XerD